MNLLTKLFEPVNIGKVEVRNRIAFPPMGTGWAQDSYITNRHLSFYEALAKGGAGLIIPEVATVDSKTSPHGIGIDDDKYIPKLKELTRALKARGAKTTLQIMHFGAQVALPGPQRLAPSPVIIPTLVVGVSREFPKEATIDDIHYLEEKYAEAVRRARDAGFDAVEYHACHACLMNQFMSPWWNRRTDEYGGTVENRMRFLLETMELARDKVGRDFPQCFRINGDEFAIGGITSEESKKQAQILEKAGAAAIHVSQRIPWTYPHPSSELGIGFSASPGRVTRGSLVYLSEGIKRAINIPVIAGNRIGDPVLAEKIVEEGRADLVALGRALLADPDLPNKAREGRLEDIRPCIACSRYCIGHSHIGRPHMGCVVNATLGREEELKITSAKKAKNVLVIGGGPGGMEAARVAALRGHKVTLYEKDSELGGQLRWAAVPPGKVEFRNLPIYLETQIRKLGVDVNLEKEFTPEMIDALKPDAVIVATGARPTVPDISGIHGNNVVTAFDVLSGKARTGRNVVVIGGGLVGAETALYLADPPLYKVTIVEMLDDVALDELQIARGFLLEALKNRGVWMLTRTKVEEINENGVVVSREGRRENLPADTAVLAVGTMSNHELVEALKGKVPEIYAIGDCVEPRKIGEAIHEGYNTALKT